MDIRFREMCEDASPVTALSFLQNTVSSVVNHADHDEAAEFRSLLSHLFARPAVDETPTAASGAGENLNGHGVGPASVRALHETAQIDPGTPTSGSESSRSGSGEWTCELKGPTNHDEDAAMSDAPTLVPRALPLAAQAHGTRMGSSSPEPGPDDPHEFTLRGDKSLSDARFVQRTAVFEGLLRFVSKKGHMKQPDGLLVDLLSNLE